MLHIVKSLGQHAKDTRAGALARDGLAALLALTLGAASALAEGPESSPESQARDLAAEVMHRAGDGDLGAWTRDIMDRALERAGRAAREAAGSTETGPGASSAPLPAERHAARVGENLAGRPDSAEILVFLSLSVPVASWAQWARKAARAEVPLVLRGVDSEGFRATVKEVGKRLGGADAGVAIDPRLFRLFGVDRVPAVVVVPGGVPPCRSRGCSSDPPPPHDLVTGNIGLMAALEAIADEGDAGRGVARRVLERLDREQ